MVHSFGDRALLIEPAQRPDPGTGWVLPLADRVRRRWPRATLVPGLASLLVVFAQPSDLPDPHEQVVFARLDPEADAGPSRTR